MYKATYESEISGGSLPPDGDPRDEELLALAKHLAPSNGELVAIEFDGEVIWTSRGCEGTGWIEPRRK